MSQHILRKDLKRDEVRETVKGTFQAFITHERTIAWIVGIAAVIVLAAFGWRTYTSRQTVKASAAFNIAMQSFEARVGSAPPTQDSSDMAFPTDQAKYTDAAQKFGQVAINFPHTRPGQLAHYYAALSLEKLGRNEDARRWLEGMAQTHESDFTALANFALAEIDQQMGHGDDAVRLYQSLIDRPSVLVPKPVAMMALADYYSRTKPAEAAKLYQQVVTQFPSTPASQQAQEQLESLPATGKS